MWNGSFNLFFRINSNKMKLNWPIINTYQLVKVTGKVIPWKHPHRSIKPDAYKCKLETRR